MLNFRHEHKMPRFRILLESARKTAQWFLNRPGITELRNADEKYYMGGQGWGAMDGYGKLTSRFTEKWMLNGKIMENRCFPLKNLKIVP